MFKNLAAFSFVLLLAQRLCLAHAPYEISHGHFVRNDGAKIQVVEYFTDGILGADPSSLIFRTPDGNVLAKTEHTRTEKAPRIKSHSVQILEFHSNWIPIASVVQIFDGQNLTAVAPPRHVWTSPLIHVAKYRFAYVIATFFVTITAIGFTIVRRMQSEGEWQYVAVLLTMIFLCITGFLGLVATLASPTSPFIVAAAAATIVWLTTRRKKRGDAANNGRANVPVSPN